jgi:uncharacterized protein (DUF302 family)
MFNRTKAIGLAIAVAIIAGLSLTGIAHSKDTPAKTAATAASNGVVRVKSVHDFETTIALLKKDVADKGIMFFNAVDQSKLGATAGIKINPSTLLIFGNPPLGVQFLTSNPDAGLDWPVRLLVTQDDKGQVWAVYTDFAWIARRHHIKDRGAAFKMAAEVIASITSKVATP